MLSTSRGSSSPSREQRFLNIHHPGSFPLSSFASQAQPYVSPCARRGVHPPGAGMLHPLADDRFDFFIAEGGGGNRDAAQLEKAKIAYSRGATGSIYSVLGPERKPKL